MLPIRYGVLADLSSLSSAYKVDVEALSPMNLACAGYQNSALTGGFTIRINWRMGNLPTITVTSSLLESNKPAGNFSITTRRSNAPISYCNGVGNCNFKSGFCGCPDGYTFDSDKGVCGAVNIRSSQWTGLETCPGIVDQTLVPITSNNQVYIYFTNFHRVSNNKTGSGVYVQKLGVSETPRMLLNLTGIYPGAIALDMSERMLYYVDKTHSVVNRKSVDLTSYYNTSESLTYKGNLSNYWVNFTSAPNDISLDLRFGYRHAYIAIPGTYTWGSRNGSIVRANLDGSPRLKTILSRLDYPTGLALDLRNNKLYYVLGQQYSTAKVYRCNLDGSDLETIVTNRFNMSKPYAIALDLGTRTAFIADRTTWGETFILAFDMDVNTTAANATKFHMVASSGYSADVSNTTTDSTIFTRKIASMTDIEHLILDPVNQWIYFTDSSSNLIYRVNYTGTYSESVVYGSQYTPVGLAIDFGYGPPVKTDYYDCWGHGNCLGFAGEFKCQCYDGYEGNCKLASCPKGKAWFDVPVDSSTAHQLVECSNRYVGGCTEVPDHDPIPAQHARKMDDNKPP